MRKKELDLYSVYRRGLRARRRKMPIYFPAVLVLLVSLSVFGILRVQNRALEEELESVYWELTQEEVQYQEVKQKWLYNEALMERVEIMSALEESRATYPKVTSALVDQIAAEGGEEISMVLKGYDSLAGTLSFRAESRQVIHIPDYVAALRETGKFEILEYSGYRYENGMYTLALHCVLKGNGEGGAS